jgi:hypothetical protein
MIKTDHKMAHVPVIILSGLADDATRYRCGQMGAHFVTKGPDALSEVKRLVVKLLALDEPVGAM